MALKFRSQPGSSSGTSGGFGPFVGQFATVTNTGSKDQLLIGGDDEAMLHPVKPGQTIYFPMADSAYVWANVAAGHSTTFVISGIQEV